MRIRASNTPNYQRNLLLKHASGLFMYFIFNEYNRDRIRLLDELCQDNQWALINAATASTSISPTFMYNGILYKPSWHVLGPGSNKEIHASMLPAIKDYFEKTDFDLLERTNRVQNYVNNVLLYCQNITDIYQLIPGRFHKVIEEINPEVYNTGDPLSPDQLEQFRTKNKAGLVELQKLLLEELLLA